MTVHPPLEPSDDAGLGAPTLGDPAAPPRPSRHDQGSPQPALYAGPPDDPDRYELLGEGVSGGEGTTWRARYRGRLPEPLPVAVKMLRPSPGDNARGGPTEEDQRRLRDLAAVLQHVRHEHVVQVKDVVAGAPPHLRGQALGAAGSQVLYVVMEWVEGPTLREVVGGLAATPATLSARLRYVADAAEALDALASRSRSGNNPALHSDVKPANAIVDEARGLVLVDVSTLRLLGDGADPDGLHTPGYTAPEVIVNPHAARAPTSDAYSLAAVAAYCLTGRDPAVRYDEQRLGRLRAELEQAATTAGARDPEGLAASIVAGLSPSPSARPGDVLVWAKGLLDAAAGAATPASAARRQPGGVVLAGVTAVIAIAAATIVGVWRPWDDGGSATTRASATAPPASRIAAVPAPEPVKSWAATASKQSSTKGTIDSPAAGSNVKACAYLSGTADVAPADRLVLAAGNLTNDDPHRYLQPVFADEDGNPRTWRGAQYFGTHDVSVGQNYRVELIAVSASERLNSTTTPAQESAIYGRSTVLDAVDVHRIPGEGPDNGCVGP